MASAPMAMHGRLSHVRHADTGIFEGIPQEFSVVRYHSLAITGPPGPEGRVTAWADDGVVMGIEHTEPADLGGPVPPRVDRHRARPRRSPKTSTRWRAASAACRRARTTGPSRARAGAETSRRRPSRRRSPTATRRCGCGCARSRGRRRPSTLFERLFAGAENAFWLDSADAPTKLAQCSYLGTSAGRDRCLVEYDVDAGEVRSSAPAATRSSTSRSSTCSTAKSPGTRWRRRPSSTAASSAASSATSGTSSRPTAARPTSTSSDMPDALLMLANRVVAVDHVRRRTYVCAVGREDDAEADAWLEAAAELVAAAIADPPPPTPLPEPEDPPEHVSLPLRPRPRALPRRHRRQPGRTGGRGVLRGLPHRPVLDRRQPRPVRPLPPPAAQQPGPVRRLPQVRRARRSSAPRRSASSRSTATAGSRRARSRARSRATTTRSSTPPAATSSRATKRRWPST